MFLAWLSMAFWLFLIGELLFLAAIYLPGADWWGRLRALFVWKETKPTDATVG